MTVDGDAPAAREPLGQASGQASPPAVTASKAKGGTGLPLAPIKLYRYADGTLDPTVPCACAVQVVSVCPYHPQLLASAGFDGDIKVSLFLNL